MKGAEVEDQGRGVPVTLIKTLIMIMNLVMTLIMTSIMMKMKKVDEKAPE